LLTEKEAAAYCGVEAGGGQGRELRALDAWIDFLSAGNGLEGAEKLRLQR
jgi:hypothetical protein